jgi:tRNA(Ile)-lysidine synthase TilS/MesJ
MKINNIELFTDDVMEIINKQEYIGIRISGGIDSAILCHIVLKYFPHVKLLPITFYNKLRPIAESSVDNVLRVLNELNPGNNLMPQVVGRFDTTGFVKIEDYVGPKRHPKDILQRQFVKDLFAEHKGKLNFILSGATMNPPLDVQQALGMEHEFNVDRNGPLANLLNTYQYKDGDGTLKYEYSPFRNSNKKEIAGICAELGLMDTLFPVSETCETEPFKYTGWVLKEHFGMTYDRPGIEPCQGCWPCREKYWAYGVFDFNTPKRVKDL